MSPVPVQSAYMQNLMSQHSHNMLASNTMPPVDLGIYFSDHTQPDISQAVPESLMSPDSPKSFIYEAPTFDSQGDIALSDSRQVELYVDFDIWVNYSDESHIGINYILIAYSHLYRFFINVVTLLLHEMTEDPCLRRLSNMLCGCWHLWSLPRATLRTSDSTGRRHELSNSLPKRATVTLQLPKRWNLCKRSF